MFFFHVFLGTVFYFLVSLIWFSPLIAGRFWLKLMNWKMENKKSYITVVCLSMFFAGLALALAQAFLLCYVLVGVTLMEYLVMLIILLFGFLAFPTLPNYLYKSQRLHISLKHSFWLWVIELKPIGLGVLVQAIYLFFMI